MSGVAIVFVVLASVLYGCATEKSGGGTVVSLELYPNGVREDVRYSIDIVGDSISSVNHYPSLVEGKPNDHRTLLPSEMDSIAIHISNVDKTVIDTGSETLDTWSARLTIDGNTVYEKDNFFIEDESYNIVELIRYIISISHIPIYLYSFS